MILRFTTVPLSIVMVLSACSNQSDSTKKEFWTWFASRESEFADLFSYESQAAARDDSELRRRIEDTVGETGDRLKEVHPEFSPFFGFSDGFNELIVTVHGQADFFKAVDDYITSAPTIEGWKFIALKQPLTPSLETEIRSGPYRLKVADWLYSKSRNDKGVFDFVIYVPAKISDDPDEFDRLFTQLTMDFLGERYASIAMGEVTVRELTDNAPDGLLPFTDILEDVRGETDKG